jgi:hypothetical protein
MFLNVDIRKELKGTVTVISEDRVAVEVTLLNEVSLGVLYYERPKHGWVNKPIMPTRWRCVDAKVEGVYQWGGEKITPTELIMWAQKLVEEVVKDKTQNKGENHKDKDESHEKKED